MVQSSDGKRSEITPLQNTHKPAPPSFMAECVNTLFLWVCLLCVSSSSCVVHTCLSSSYFFYFKTVIWRPHTSAAWAPSGLITRMNCAGFVFLSSSLSFTQHAGVLLLKKWGKWKKETVAEHQSLLSENISIIFILSSVSPASLSVPFYFLPPPLLPPSPFLRLCVFVQILKLCCGSF